MITNLLYFFSLALNGNNVERYVWPASRHDTRHFKRILTNYQGIYTLCHYVIVAIDEMKSLKTYKKQLTSSLY